MRYLFAAFLWGLSTLGACSPASPSSDVQADSRFDASSDIGSDLARDQRLDRRPCKLVKPYTSKDVDCNQCAGEKCCPEMNACLGDPKCDDDYVNCILACTLLPAPDAGVSACLQACATDHPEGKAAYDLATACADAKCSKECT